MSADSSARGEIRRLLVPLDGSRLAETVVPFAIALGARLGARVILLHVMERAAPAVVHGDRHLTDTVQAEEYLAGVAARFAGAVEVERHVHPNPQNDVANSIADHAVDLNADLIVLCTHGRGNARRMLFGSVAQRVVNRGTTPILLLRPDDRVRPADADALDVRRIVAPLDGGAASEAVLPLVAVLASAYRAAVTLVRVVPTLATVTGEQAGVAKFTPSATAASLDLEDTAADTYLRAVATCLRAGHTDISVVVVRGEPAHKILEIAARTDAGIIAMATHGRAGLDAFVSGSVASIVAAKYPRPILLVRSTHDRPVPTRARAETRPNTPRA